MITMAGPFHADVKSWASATVQNTECYSCHNSHSLVTDHWLMFMKHRSLWILKIGETVPRNGQYVNFIFTLSTTRTINVIVKAATSVGPRAFTLFFSVFWFLGFSFMGDDVCWVGDPSLLCNGLLLHGLDVELETRELHCLWGRNGSKIDMMD